MKYTKKEVVQIEWLKQEKVYIQKKIDKHNDIVASMRKISGRPDYLKLL